MKVPEGWEVKKLGEIADLNPRESLHKGKVYPYIDMASVSENNRLPKRVLYKEYKGSGSKFRKGDVLFARITPCLENGKTAFVKDFPQDEVGIGSTEFIVIRQKKGVSNGLFLYYLSRWNTFREIAKKKMFGTSGRQRVSAQALESINVPYPPLPEQQKIAEILGSIDDQIENLMEQNKTLEEIAETIFKEWIIKKNNENWDRRPLDRIAVFLNGLPCQKYPPKNNKEKLPVLKIKELQNGFDKNSDWASSEIPSKYIVQNGDIVFSWSGTLMVKIWNGGKCFLNQHLFKVFSKEYPKWFYYFWTKHYLKHFIAIAKSKATTMGHIKRKDLSKTLVKVPSHKELKKLDRILSPMIDKIITNNQKIQTLTQLRDTLLPKLITGEIRVKV